MFSPLQSLFVCVLANFVNFMEQHGYLKVKTFCRVLVKMVGVELEARSQKYIILFTAFSYNDNLASQEAVDTAAAPAEPSEAVETSAAPMEPVAELPEPSQSSAFESKVDEEPVVITMDAVSVPDESQVSEEIKAMLENIHTDPYSEDEVSVLLQFYNTLAC